jgi:hypothetical protein
MDRRHRPRDLIRLVCLAGRALKHLRDRSDGCRGHSLIPYSRNSDDNPSQMFESCLLADYYSHNSLAFLLHRRSRLESRCSGGQHTRTPCTCHPPGTSSVATRRASSWTMFCARLTTEARSASTSSESSPVLLGNSLLAKANRSRSGRARTAMHPTLTPTSWKSPSKDVGYYEFPWCSPPSECS